MFGCPQTLQGCTLASVFCMLSRCYLQKAYFWWMYDGTCIQLSYLVDWCLAGPSRKLQCHCMHDFLFLVFQTMHVLTNFQVGGGKDAAVGVECSPSLNAPYGMDYHPSWLTALCMTMTRNLAGTWQELGRNLWLHQVSGSPLAALTPLGNYTWHDISRILFSDNNSLEKVMNKTIVKGGGGVPILR